MIKHIILLKLKTHIENETLHHLYQQMREIKNQIPGILSFSFGKNQRSESEHLYTHVIMMDFVDQDYYQFYQKHPKTQDFQANVKAALVDTYSQVIIDYDLETIH